MENQISSEDRFDLFTLFLLAKNWNSIAKTS